MVHVTVEYMIMIPVLIAQIFIFPYTASVMMNSWSDQRHIIELNEVAGHLGSSIQQLYFSINQASLATGTLTMNLDTPKSIDGYAYKIIFRNASSTDPSNPTKVLNLTLSFLTAQGQASTLVTLGNNAAWKNNCVYYGNTTMINATKTGGQVWLSLVTGGT
jgi:hypothetical protein